MLCVSVIGCGYLGAVQAVCLARLGHEVVGIDVLAEHIASLQAGRAPFHEPGMPDMLNEAIAVGRLTFSTDPSAAAQAVVHFICVGTPQKEGEYAADLTSVHAAVADLLPSLTSGDVVVGKSTVPVGTAENLRERVRDAQPGAELLWSPEFLREGSAIQDTLAPDRFVYGAADCDSGRSAMAVLDEVYAIPLASGVPKIETNLATAELVKVAANSFLATKISFINTMAELCDITGADVAKLADAVGHDDRIGRRFLNPGIGFGGGCLPKDVRTFMAQASEVGAYDAFTFLREVDSINMRRGRRTVDLVREVCGGSIVGRTIAVLGAAFKPNSDDVRDSPALSVAAEMQLQGAFVIVTDPKAVENARKKWPDLNFATRVEDAVREAEVVLLATEWPEYVALNPAKLASRVAATRIVDGRNCLDPTTWRAAGWTYRALGRP